MTTNSETGAATAAPAEEAPLEPNVALLRTRGSKVFIVALAMSFPSIEHKVRTMGLDRHPERFDRDQWLKCSGAWSSGEIQAARFIATVWNWHHAKGKKWCFDAVDAAGIWSTKDKQAFAKWFINPVWP